MMRMLPSRRNRNLAVVPGHRPCPCHDPLVFGHITCRGETQPGNTAPPAPGTSVRDTAIPLRSLSAGYSSYGEPLRNTARSIEDITAMIRYFERRQREKPPPHG